MVVNLPRSHEQTEDKTALRHASSGPTTCSVPFHQGLQLSCSVRSLNLQFATRLVVFHLIDNVYMQPGSDKLSSECLPVCEYCERCPFPKFLFFVETIGTDIAGVVVAVGGERHLMYFFKADVTDLRKPQREGIVFSP